ncbi:tetratricopeptide repeat protein, partial [Leptothrix ochracea]
MNHPKLPPLEAAWQTLRSSLEWAQEFGLVFVFCSDRDAKQALFQRANDLMQTQVRPFQRPEARQATDLIQCLLPIAINPASVHVDVGMPLWLDLDGHPGAASWDEARREFLHRLNERRAALVREHGRTVVLALPLDWTKPTAEAAPDLWTIRQPSVYLEPPETQGFAQQPPSSVQVVSSVSTPVAALHSPPSRDLPAAVLRWQAGQDRGQAVSPWDAAQAIEAALASGHSELAWPMAQETAQRARTLVAEFGKSPERMRDLAVALHKLGDVAQTMGRLDEAQQAYRESEQLTRTLMTDFGKSPDRMRDLSVSMGKLGNVAQALGRLDEAQQAYRESEQLTRSLVADFGRTPER